MIFHKEVTEAHHHECRSRDGVTPTRQIGVKDYVVGRVQTLDSSVVKCYKS